MKKPILIPPPIVFILCALLMKCLPPLFILPVPRSFSLLLAVFGGLLGLLAAWQFRQYKTTISPVELAKSSFLVTNGIFALSRNPMYLSLLIVLLSWAFYLTSTSALLGVAILFAYLNYWQIPAEETALQSQFGADYLAYCQRVRRWI